MLHACAIKFDVMRNLEKFLGELNKASVLSHELALAVIRRLRSTSARSTSTAALTASSAPAPSAIFPSRTQGLAHSRMFMRQ